MTSAKLLSDRLFDTWNDYLSVALQSDLPAVTYHYTTAAGLHGILSSKCVYATDKHFLNDRTEVKHGTDTAISALEAKIKGSTRDQKELLEVSCDYMRAEREERHFIFSMSERQDDLSQWRGYSDDGNGYTLGFDTSFFRNVSVGQTAPFGFNRVSYSNPQFRALITKLVAEYSEAIDEGESASDVAPAFSGSLEAAACYYKHNSFRFEREWRAVSYVYPDDDEEILVRSSGSRLIPYVKFPLCEKGGALPILEIGIGPSVSNPNTRVVIADLCKAAGISPKIYDANTPYVRY